MSQSPHNIQPGNVPQPQPGNEQSPAGSVAPGMPQPAAPVDAKKGVLSKKIARGGAAVVVVGLLAAIIGSLWPNAWLPANLESVGQEPKTIIVEKGSPKRVYLTEENRHKAMFDWKSKCTIGKEDGSESDLDQDVVLNYYKDGAKHISIAEISEAGKYQVACPNGGFIGDPVNLRARQVVAVGVLLVVLGALVGGVAFVVSKVRRR